MKNIFITGPMRIGKSTIIKRILSQKSLDRFVIGGYFTMPIVENHQIVGYAIRDMNGMSYNFAHIKLDSDMMFDKYRIDVSAFDDCAAAILNQSIKESDLIVIDEIGVIEKDAAIFKQTLSLCLNSDVLCIGVFQQRASWFKEMIAIHEDTLIWGVTEKNRSLMHEYILQEMKK
ncbi:hypothetical protein JXB12_11630 [candidate division KSB1 bacterium]|nr:hypothetical protein [candidate division KSB1 bacterium]